MPAATSRPCYPRPWSDRRKNGPHQRQTRRAGGVQRSPPREFLKCFPVFVPPFLPRTNSNGGEFRCSVVSSRCSTAPRAACEPEVCVFPLRVVFRAFLLLICFIFLLFLPFFRFRFWTSFVLSCLFLGDTMYVRVLGCLLAFCFCCDSFSI